MDFFSSLVNYWHIWLIVAVVFLVPYMIFRFGMILISRIIGVDVGQIIFVLITTSMFGGVYYWMYGLLTNGKPYDQWSENDILGVWVVGIVTFGFWFVVTFTTWVEDYMKTDEFKTTRAVALGTFIGNKLSGK